MSIARKLVAFVLAGALCGCATFGGAAARAPLAPAASAAQEALALLELVEYVEAAAVAAAE